MKKTALITGITGQDGAYLAKFLLEKNYHVIGVVRNFNKNYNSKLEFLKIDKSIQFEESNLMDVDKLTKIFKNEKPLEVYNLAAQSSITYSFKEPYETIFFNSLSVLNILNLINQSFKDTKLLQAVSSDIFSGNKTMPISEESPINPTSPYGISKAFNFLAVKKYRIENSLFCSNAILFNHDSFLRGNNYFIKKIINSAILIKNNKLDILKIGNLDVKRDFGYAPEYVKAMWLMLQSENADDYCVCSGVSVSLRKIVEYIFDKLDINLNRIVVDDNLIRNNELKEIYGDNSKIRANLNWNYNMSFFSVIDILINEELQNQ